MCLCLFIPECLRLVTHGLSKTGASDQSLANPLEFNANTDITYTCTCTCIHTDTRRPYLITQSYSVSFPIHVLVFNLYGQIMSNRLSLNVNKRRKGSLLVNQDAPDTLSEVVILRFPKFRNAMYHSSQCCPTFARKTMFTDSTANCKHAFATEIKQHMVISVNSMYYFYVL